MSVSSHSLWTQGFASVDPDCFHISMSVIALEGCLPIKIKPALGIHLHETFALQSSVLCGGHW